MVEYIKPDFDATTGLRAVCATLIYFGHYFEYYAPLEFRTCSGEYYEENFPVRIIFKLIFFFYRKCNKFKIDCSI